MFDRFEARRKGFRAALRQASNRGSRLSLAERRMAKQFSDDEDLVDLLVALNESEIDEAYPSDVPAGAAALGGGAFVDMMMNAMRFFVENLPAILDQITKIINIFSALG